MPGRCCSPFWPIAYRYVRNKHVANSRFTFGTGKLGNLAGFTSAMILAMIAVLIGYEAITRSVAPVPIHFAGAIPIAWLGPAVNMASAWPLPLSAGGHHHHHLHDHTYEREGHEYGDQHRIVTPDGILLLSVFEEVGVVGRAWLIVGAFMSTSSRRTVPLNVSTRSSISLRTLASSFARGFCDHGLLSMAPYIKAWIWS